MLKYINQCFPTTHLSPQRMVYEIFSTLNCVSMIQYIKFDQNSSFCSKLYSKRKHNFGHNLKFLSAGVTLKIW